ncbi:NAD-dependent epimerase/dehydratase family protein [Curvibacter sp. CHRR-16]|uniref:NAD-dependent epimerase/dehydratase family protein n=1 Tax=Curvibacter sp. CHRR-16 TaxID=2835872 RepID=UPI001BD93232|nr:NAD-dependent epimerase/dehydratase family protein [Curvibacter sp. CHRR-16]MBT0569031.1 NAD-dependent epimerase/dehydratase family protein [Curvibacter sp. CHRR-16]
MRVLITGGAGFMGSHMAQALQAAGHSVLAVSRRSGVDQSLLTTPAQWQHLLQGVDAVVNCVGIIGERGTQRFDTVHHQAPAALFAAAHAQGIRRMVQISALGADEHAFTPYQRSKRAADDALRALDADWLVLRPSMVYGKGGSSTAMFVRMSSLPVISVLGNGQQLLQPVHVSDVAAAVVRAIDAPAGSPLLRRTVDAVGPQVYTLPQWLQTLRQARGKGRALQMPVPWSLVMASASVLRYVHPVFHPDNLRMLQAGACADATGFTELLGRAPKGFEAGLV